MIIGPHVRGALHACVDLLCDAIEDDARGATKPRKATRERPIDMSKVTPEGLKRTAENMRRRGLLPP